MKKSLMICALFFCFSAQACLPLEAGGEGSSMVIVRYPDEFTTVSWECTGKIKYRSITARSSDLSMKVLLNGSRDEIKRVIEQFLSK